MKHELVQAASATDILLTEGVVLLGVALAFVILFRRLGLGAVLGYLIAGALVGPQGLGRSEEHTSALQSLMRISYAVFCLINSNFSLDAIITHLQLPPSSPIYMYTTISYII